MTSNFIPDGCKHIAHAVTIRGNIDIYRVSSKVYYATAECTQISITFKVEFVESISDEVAVDAICDAAKSEFIKLATKEAENLRKNGSLTLQ
jgi:hypothetical protein